MTRWRVAAFVALAAALAVFFAVHERLPGASLWWDVAIIASLVESCKLCGVDPQANLADVMSRIVTGHLNTRIDDLLPWAYATAPDLKAVA